MTSNAKLAPAAAVYLHVAESAWNAYIVEIADHPAHQWFMRVRAETYLDACAMGFSGSEEQWGKEMRAAGDRISARRLAPRL